MFGRSLQNLLAGRKKTIDEEVGVEAARALLGTLDAAVQGSIAYQSANWQFDQRGLTGDQLLAFLDNHFSTSYGDYYVDIRHQVYAGMSGEKHYLNLQKGNLYYEKKEDPFRMGTIEFLVQ